MKIKSKSFLTNIQKYYWDCGVACVCFLLDNKGQKVVRRAIVKELKASKDNGTDLVELVNFLKKRPEFKAKEKNNWSFDDLKRELTKGRVCLVAYQNWDRQKDIGRPDWGHYGIVVGIKRDKLKLFDPGSKTGITEFSWDDFEKRWYETDLGVYYPKWAMSLNLM